MSFRMVVQCGWIGFLSCVCNGFRMFFDIPRHVDIVDCDEQMRGRLVTSPVVKRERNPRWEDDQTQAGQSVLLW